MAIGEGFFGNQAGMGQGLAYVLPQSKSEGYALQLAQDESKLLANQAAAKLKREQGLQDAIGKQFAAQKLPALWSPYNKAVSDASSAWQQKAAQYNATTGRSPFTNPDLMNEYNTGVSGLALQSKELGDRYTKLYSAAAADGGNKYTPESVKQVLDYQATIEKDPLNALKQPLPELKKASANFDDFAKLIKPQTDEVKTGSLNTIRPNRSAHIDQARTTVLSNPEKWAPMLLEQFNVDITKPTFPVPGNTGRNVYPTNDKAVDFLADQVIASPNGLTQIAEFGIDPQDPFVKERLKDVIKRQNEGFGKFLTQSADNADAKVKRSTARSYDAERMQQSRERLDLARKASARADAKSDGEGDQDVLFRQQLVDDMLNGVPNSGERVKAIVAGKGYDEDLKIQVIGDKISLAIPPKTVAKAKVDKDGKVAESATVTPGRTVTIDKSQAGSRDKLNEVLNEVTGENIKGSKFATGQASGKIKGKVVSSAPITTAKQVPLSKVKSLVGKKGYEGYTEKELVDYYKSQGYTIK